MAKRLESSIQASVVEYARKKNCLAIKQGTIGKFGTAGWPDYLFIPPRGNCFFIEFKVPGNTMTALQQQRAKELGDHNMTVYVVDNVLLGRTIIDRWSAP